MSRSCGSRPSCSSRIIGRYRRWYCRCRLDTDAIHLGGCRLRSMKHHAFWWPGSGGSKGIAFPKWHASWGWLILLILLNLSSGCTHRPCLYRRSGSTASSSLSSTTCCIGSVRVFVNRIVSTLCGTSWNALRFARNCRTRSGSGSSPFDGNGNDWFAAGSLYRGWFCLAVGRSAANWFVGLIVVVVIVATTGHELAKTFQCFGPALFHFGDSFCCLWLW